MIKLGYFEDNSGLSLALGTTSSTVVIISPHADYDQSTSAQGVALRRKLAINREITCLESAQLNQQNDIVLVGTATNLLAYNVAENSDIFYKDIPDGVHCMIYGSLSLSQSSNKDCIVVGGNCSISAYDTEGEELFWTVTSDNVLCLELCDWDCDGINELIVGSEDNFLRMFKNEQILCEISETDSVTHLKRIDGIPSCFGYALKNGSVGVYKGETKQWKYQSKESVTCLDCFDMSYSNSSSKKTEQQTYYEDPTKDLAIVIGWSNGLVEVRNVNTGKLMWKSFCDDSMGTAVAGIIVGDMRGAAQNQIITVSAKGTITAWILQDPNDAVTNSNNNAPSAAFEKKAKHESRRISFMSKSSKRKSIDMSNMNNNNSDPNKQLATKEEEMIIADLQNEKSKWKRDLENIEANWTEIKSGSHTNDPGLIPTNTEIACTLTPSLQQKSLLLIMSTNNSTVIKCAIIYGDKVFKNGSFMVMPDSPETTVKLPLKFVRDLQCNLSIKAIVGHLSSKQDHIFELSHRIPQFSSYLYVSISQVPHDKKPKSFVTFTISDRLNRVVLWLNQAFLLEYESSNKKSMNIAFVSLRTGLYVIFKVNQVQKNASGHGQSENCLEIAVMCDDLQLACDIVQDLTQYLGVVDLQSRAHFPIEFGTKLNQMFTQIEQFQSIRKKLSIDIASNTAIIKNLIVTSEDSRLLKNWKPLRESYAELTTINEDMIQEHKKRETNHIKLLETLKQMNQIIDKAAKLRSGRFSKQVISQARSSIKKKNIEALSQVLRTGSLVSEKSQHETKDSS